MKNGLRPCLGLCAVNCVMCVKASVWESSDCRGSVCKMGEFLLLDDSHHSQDTCELSGVSTSAEKVRNGGADFEFAGNFSRYQRCRSSVSPLFCLSQKKTKKKTPQNCSNLLDVGGLLNP